MRIEVVDYNSPQLATVKKLGKENASTLGFLPEGAFDERASKGQILIALDDNDNCLGYLLYRIVNSQAKIVHLCIGKDSRKSGVGLNLVQHLKHVTKDLKGISLKCRRDYGEATNLWQKCNFIPLGESAGRGKVPSILVYWWFDHGHPTLFDKSHDSASDSKINIVIDANVFFDFDDPSRVGFEESNSLTADWLADSLNICVVEELFQEIHRNTDIHTRKLSREKACQYQKLYFDESRVNGLSVQIKYLYAKEEERLSQRDISDIRQVAEAMCGDAQYFVTRDEFLLDIIAGPVYKNFGLRILRPAELVIEIDEIRREQEYQPARLAGTTINQSLIKSGQEEDLVLCFQQLEPKKEFKTRLRSYLSNINDYICWQIVDEGNNSLAIGIYKQSGKQKLEIPLFRVQKSKLSPTLTRHLILKIVNDALKFGNSLSKITDPYLNQELKTALVEQGFIETSKYWVKYHLNNVLSKDETVKRIEKLDSQEKNEKDFIKNACYILGKYNYDISADAFVEVEKAFYPLKITDSIIPCFIIPIRPQWAKELFDVELANQGLFGSKHDLALRTEQVYYRSKRNSAGITGPARILWYVSLGDGKYSNVGAIRASSYVDNILVDKPKVIFNLFKRLGIYEWKDIYKVAKQDITNEIMAVKFSHTELFKKPIMLGKMRHIFNSYNCKLQLQSPSSIPQNMFMKFYSEGILDI